MAITMYSFSPPGINLDRLSFQQWLDFLFDHNPEEDENKENENLLWYGAPEVILRRSTQLFKDPEPAIRNYKRDQLYQGFWYLPEGQMLRDYIWDMTIDRKIRCECIASMYYLFERLFAKDSLDDTCFMWFDFFRSFSEKEDPQIQEELLHTLTRIISLDNEDCRLSALHGLGHLNHPARQSIIQEFLHRHQNLEDEIREYAEQALLGNIL